uniref:Uncharacterized protein n=1 Tax=Glossina palpalis gambiensis TaxID=67801 RepID=A0A1B0C024_9MUSC
MQFRHRLVVGFLCNTKKYPKNKSTTPPTMFKNTFNVGMKSMRITATGNAVYVYCNHKNSIMFSKRLQMEKICGIFMCI